MEFFRKLIIFLLISVFIFGLGFAVFEKSQPQIRNYIAATKPCQTPIKYAIDSIDPRFNISIEKLRDILNTAENLWEKNSGLNIFEYSPQAELKVRLVYDERQQQTFEAGQLEESLKNLDEQRSVLEKQQSTVSKEYDKQFALFKKEVNEYEDRLKKYNKDVARWNSQGGTSEDEYNKLKKEESRLKKEFEDLKEEEDKLNALASKSNTIITQENKIINNYNQTVTTYKSKFGNSQEFEKGIFDPTVGIIIYQFREATDLELTLVHELGHALGIGHVENPKSIMYYMIGEQNLDTITLTEEDVDALKSVCQLNQL